LANTTIGVAAALIVVGVVGYVATNRQSATALIPAFLGLLGTIGGLIRLLGGTTTPAAISQGLTAILTGALLALCVKSFIDARRRRAQG